MTSGQENAPSWQAVVRDGRNWVWKNAMVGGVPVSSPSFKLLLHFYMLKWPSLPFTSLLYRLVFKEVYREEKLLRHVPMVTKFRNFVQRRLRNVRKSMMHVQSCCFANLNLLLFCCSHCHGCHHCLSSLLKKELQEGKGEEKIGWKKPHSAGTMQHKENSTHPWITWRM